MKVRNLRRIIFMKGIELERDLPSGATGMVLKEFERSERILQAIQSGALEEVGYENTKVGTSIVHTPIETDEYFASLIGKPAISSVEVSSIRRAKGTQSKDETPTTVEGQLEKFNRLNGRAKLNFAKEITSLAVVRQALTTIRKGKVKEALAARLVELQPKSLNLDAIPTEEKVGHPNRPESI